MRIIVTGAAGFIGSAIARRALRDGHEVVGVDCLTDYYDPSIKLQNLDTLRGDGFSHLNRPIQELSSDVLDGVDVVYHQAGQPGVRNSWGTDFSTYTAANISATQTLLECMVRAESKARLVYASSSSVYGNAETFPTPENVMPQPVSPYGVTKLAAEHLVTLYALNRGVDAVSLRYFTVYGPGQRPDMAFTRFTKAAVRGDTISLFGTGEQIRDFTFIDDVVEANWLAGEADLPAGAVYNVAGGSSTSVNEALSIIERLVGSKLAIDRQPAVTGDAVRTGGATGAIRAALGWTPLVSIEDGLREHLDWARRAFAEKTH